MAATTTPTCRRRTSGTTRTPDRSAPSPGRCSSRRAGSRSCRVPRLQLTKAGRKALSEPAAETIRTLWTKWAGHHHSRRAGRASTASRDRPERASAGSPPCRRGGTRSPTPWPSVPPGGWIATEEFFRYMRASEHDFAVTRDAWGLYIGDPQYGSLGYEGGAVHPRTSATCSVCCFEYAATLGLIDVAVIPPAGARPDYRQHVGHGRPPVLQPLRRADVLPHQSHSARTAWAWRRTTSLHPSR